MEDTKILLGKRIRNLRKESGISQEGLAEQTDISAKYLGQIERGLANLSIDKAIKISKALKIDLSELFDFKYEHSRKELKQQLNSLFDDAKDKDIKKIVKVVKYLLK
ncbi:HTH domain-containing protein, Cro/C1-type [Desulfonema limicola]|uniref:HTH domain-containing protein, Cro/C1-type n=1 Tax=Desulfonema limicola TaxID=45656 RepID=A0A975B487_9BACT|nr:helix-turn-helix transcriptional regulator [Desulfonema limicola]QTA78514.1 HTH domain-containing protein, Cro/C1-type [Desulfonema limicola]